MVSVVADPCSKDLAPHLPVPSQLEGLRPGFGALFGEVGMMGVFVQVNVKSRKAKAQPVGYVIQENGCWQWAGSIDKDGYGTWNGRRAHRRIYEKAGRAVPSDRELDHLCRNRGCVNPDHLAVVTHRVNTLRGDTLPARNAAKTHCPQGHPYDESNTEHCVSVNRKAHRLCRICRYNNEQSRRPRSRKGTK